MTFSCVESKAETTQQSGVLATKGERWRMAGGSKASPGGWAGGWVSGRAGGRVSSVTLVSPWMVFQERFSDAL